MDHAFWMERVNLHEAFYRISAGPGIVKSMEERSTTRGSIVFTMCVPGAGC